MPVKARTAGRNLHRGVAAAELAILLVPLTILMLGTIDFCRCFYAYNTINNCARNAAVWASDPYSNTSTLLWSPPSTSTSLYATVTAAAQADASNLSPLPTVEKLDANGKLKASAYGTDSKGNTTVTVTVDYNFTMLSSYIFGGTTIAMSCAVTMRASPP